MYNLHQTKARRKLLMIEIVDGIYIEIGYSVQVSCVCIYHCRGEGREDEEQHFMKRVCGTIRVIDISSEYGSEEF